VIQHIHSMANLGISSTVYATNLHEPPSWYNVASHCSKEQLLHMCYVAEDSSDGFGEECMHWHVYAHFASPVSIQDVKQAFENKPGDSGVLVEACNNNFVSLKEYRKRAPHWAHLTPEDFM
jgi:hypothetical protein